MTPTRPCWCGEPTLAPFNADYNRCPACETLIYRHESNAAIGRVSDVARKPIAVLLVLDESEQKQKIDGAERQEVPEVGRHGSEERDI